MEHFEELALERQHCFRLYATSKELIRRYKEWLDPLGLSYTQYLVMLVLWEQEKLRMQAIGKALRLDSGTLTPVLTKLEAAGLVARETDATDGRASLFFPTKQGWELQKEARKVPHKMASCVPMKPERAALLAELLDEALSLMSE